MGKRGPKSGLDWLPDDERQRFIEYSKAGVPVKELALLFGYSASAIKIWRQQLGLQRESGSLRARNLVETELFEAFKSSKRGSDFFQAKQTVASIQLAAEYLLDAVPYTYATHTPGGRLAAALALLDEFAEEPLSGDEAASLRDELARLIADPSRMNAGRRDDKNGDGESLMMAADRLRKQMRRQRRTSDD
jgi:hypothetical protein